MNHKSFYFSHLSSGAKRALQMLLKLPKDLTILVIAFSIVFAGFGIRDILDYQNMPPTKTNLEDVYGYYEPKRLQATVLKYRKDIGEPITGYSTPTTTTLAITIDKITRVSDADAIATIEGTIIADWDENSVQDYQNAGNQLEASAKSDIFSVLKLNFASQEERLFRPVWRSQQDEAGIKRYRALHEYKGSFRLAQDYRKFPFDTSKAIIELSTDLNSADIHLEGDIANSNLNDPEWRVNSYYYAKSNCEYSRGWKLDKQYYTQQFYCVEDEFKNADPDVLGDFIDDKKLDKNSIEKVLTFTPVVTFTAYLSRAPGSSFFRYIAPIMFVIAVASIFDQLNDEAWEIKIAIPPTILLTLIFMHSGYRAEIDQISYVTFMDRIYFLAYASCMLLLMSTILSKSHTTQNQSAIAEPAKAKRIYRLVMITRGAFLLTTIVGPFAAYFLS